MRKTWRKFLPDENDAKADEELNPQAGAIRVTWRNIPADIEDDSQPMTMVIKQICGKRFSQVRDEAIARFELVKHKHRCTVFGG